LGLRAVIFLALAIALMVANQQIATFAQMRSHLAIVVLPLQTMVDKPIQLFSWIGTSIVTQQEVLGENAKLRARQLLLEAKLQRLLALERENEQLRELLSSSGHLPGKTLIARLLSVGSDALSQQLTLDKGARDELFVGQPVLDAYGIIGQIIDVSPFTSQVMMVSDSRSVIPVQNNRNGTRAAVAGMGYSDQLSLLNISVTADIAVGDVLVTSGLGGKFPFGYPVGEIISIQRNSGERFAIVSVKPSAHLDKSRQMILLWPEQEPAQSMSATKAPAKKENKKTAKK
jgi:rod shape-determining protein MreC